MPEQPARQVRRHEGQHPRLGRLHDIFAEPVKGQRARPALIDHRGDTGPHPDEIGVEAEIPRDVLVDMRMSVDQAGCHDKTGRVDHLGRAGVEPGRNGGDATLLDADIANVIDIVGGIDDVPALHDQIIAGFQLGDRGIRSRYGLVRLRHDQPFPQQSASIRIPPVLAVQGATRKVPDPGLLRGQWHCRLDRLPHHLPARLEPWAALGVKRSPERMPDATPGLSRAGGAVPLSRNARMARHSISHQQSEKFRSTFRMHHLDREPSER